MASKLNIPSSVPARPTIDTVQVTNKSITIEWFQANGDRVDKYLINYFYQDRCNHSFNSEHILYGSKQTNVTLGNLEEFSNYQVNITAMNTQGASSVVMNISTLSSGKN